ncbi:MAG: ROK family protein [Bacteroidales bacterium]|nr:ROK family protein [Bacteroidales bacterium]
MIMNILGFDIGGTKCACVLGQTDCTEQGIEIVDKLAFPTEKGPHKTIGKLFETAHEIMNRNKLAPKDIIGIGISCGGPLDSRNGIILSPPNLPGWDNIHIVEMTEKHFGIKAFVQNDANACAMAEWKYGAGKGYDNVVFFTFGTGMGAGLILDGRLYSGTTDLAGEVGHIRLSENGPVGFGKEGSFEGWCSGGGIAQVGQIYARKRIQMGEKTAYCSSLDELSNVTAKSIAEAAYASDETALAVYRTISEYLGHGLSTIIDIINPQVIILGSIYGRSKELIEEHMMKVINSESISYSAKACKIVPAALSENIGDMAALVLGIEASKKN